MILFLYVNKMSSVIQCRMIISKSARFLSNLRFPTVPINRIQNFHKCSQEFASVQILMPSLSPTMKEGAIMKWYKKEGDAIRAGDLLCDIETDKAVVSLESEEEGTLAKILKPEKSSEIKIGSLIAIMVEEGEDWHNVDVPAQAPAPVEKKLQEPTDKKLDSQQTTGVSTAPTSLSNAEDSHAHGIGPSVRKLLEEYGLNPRDIKGTGPNERISKGDILKVIASKNLHKVTLNAQPTPSKEATPVSHPDVTAGAGVPQYSPQTLTIFDGAAYVDKPNTNMRSIIAKRLTLSKTTIPHSYVVMDCNVGQVSQLRKQMVKDEIKVSVNDFIIKAAAVALQRVPQVNSVWQNDVATPLLNVDISVAVATDNGLITPIIKNAPHLAVDEISARVRDLATRARSNKLQLNEFQGGTFTISNLGMFGITEFSAVINPPQTAILAIGESGPVLAANGKPESQMTVTLSYDARVIDDAEASQFLEVFRDTIENPHLLVSGRSASKRSNI